MSIEPLWTLVRSLIKEISFSQQFTKVVVMVHQMVLHQDHDDRNRCYEVEIYQSQDLDVSGNGSSCMLLRHENQTLNHGEKPCVCGHVQQYAPLIPECGCK